MYEDFNERDFELNAIVSQCVQQNDNKQNQLNTVAFAVKFVLQTYLSNKNIKIQTIVPYNVISFLKQCILLLQDIGIQVKMSTFLRTPSVESAQDVVNELNKYIATHEIKHN